MSSAHLVARRHSLIGKPDLMRTVRPPADSSCGRDWATICLLLMYIFYLAGRTQFYACAAYF